MKLLADTHVVLWLADRASCGLVPPAATAALADPANDLLISAITPWELSLKHWLGKLPEAAPLLDTWQESVTRLRATILPVSDRHGLLAGRLDWVHKDPFDRMLAAQAMVEGAVLVSTDAAFDAVAGLTRLWDSVGSISR